MKEVNKALRRFKKSPDFWSFLNEIKKSDYPVNQMLCQDFNYFYYLKCSHRGRFFYDLQIVRYDFVRDYVNGGVSFSNPTIIKEIKPTPVFENSCVLSMIDNLLKARLKKVTWKMI